MVATSVLVTGCSSGIGQCIALGLQARGYHVLATARGERDLDWLAYRGLDPIPLELADPDSVAEAVNTVQEKTADRLWAIVNNAAYGQPGAVEDLSRAALREQFEVNLFGTHELTCRLIPTLRAQGAGRIVNISSVLGMVSLPYRGAYNASKFALEGLTDTLRLELATSGLDVILIEPGPIRSNFRENARRHFQSRIDSVNTPHREVYVNLAARLESDKEDPFTLGPEAVLAKSIKALESRHPRPRYFVTLPTYLFAGLKRLLPTKWLDILLYWIA